ncbi:hypothetical protein QTO30_14700 [Yoonia sp. GPGPB17]|uniref:hypothetical protein n=1 Tax=Yoonia sp. GPGPB17 TaxID=3026147 RepID=UPI0030C0D9D4
MEDGDDIVFGDVGSDYIDGGSENTGDLLSYELLANGVQFNLGAEEGLDGTAVFAVTDRTNPTLWQDFVSNFENISLTNSDDIVAVTEELLDQAGVTVDALEQEEASLGGVGDDILIGGRDFREATPTNADYAADDPDFLYGGAGFDTYHAVRNDQIFDRDFTPDGQVYGDGEVFYEGLLLTGGSEVPLGTAPFLSIPQLGLTPESFTYYEAASGEFYCVADTTYTFQELPDRQPFVLS